MKGGKKKLPVRWDPAAKQLLDEIYDNIAQDTVNAARHVKKSLVQLGNSLGRFPEKYSERNTWKMYQATIGLYQNGDTRLSMR